jgi:polyisoprenoid-binding protein YceI
MKISIVPAKTFLAAAVLCLFVSVSMAADLIRFDAQPGSKVKLEGTSTVHDWTMEGNIIAGYLELDPSFPTDPAAKPSPGKVNARGQVTIPVRSIKSGKKTMDEVMQEAMKQKDFPKIEYRLTEMTLNGTPAAGQTLQFETRGELSIAGVTNKVILPVTMERIDKSKLKITGMKALRMTDYGVQPPAPKLALGAIKTGDDIKISFEWTVLQGGSAPKP